MGKVNLITVAHATREEQVEIPLEVESSCTVAIAIRRSGILKKFQEIKLENVRVGVYGKSVSLDTLVKNRDRIEIYRPLQIDPKQARLTRAKKKISVFA